MNQKMNQKINQKAYQKAVFLDRDGTINKDTGYVHKKADLEFLPGAVEGLLNFQKKGFLLIIITNQSGIGRGYYSEKDYESFMQYMYLRLKEEGVEITADYHCPHLPEDQCFCRKPATGLVEKAVNDYGIDVQQSIFVGDRQIDIQTGQQMGMKAFLVSYDDPGHIRSLADISKKI